MGTPLFGIDISGLIYSNFKGQLQAMTLVKSTYGTRNPLDLGGPNTGVVTTSYPCEGIIDDRNLQGAGTGYRPNDNVVRHERQVSILGDSLPVVDGVRIVPLGVPNGTNNDKVIVGALTYTIVRVKSDPAQAMYICTVRA